MRACVDRRDLASLRGVDPGRSSLVASMLSTTLAGLAGVLGAPLLSLDGPNTYTEAMLISAAAAVFARFTSIPLAFVFGLAIGVIQNLIAGYITPHVGFTRPVQRRAVHPDLRRPAAAERDSRQTRRHRCRTRRPRGFDISSLAAVAPGLARGPSRRSCW